MFKYSGKKCAKKWREGGTSGTKREKESYSRRSYGKCLKSAIDSVKLELGKFLDCSLGTNPFPMEWKVQKELKLEKFQNYPDPEYKEFREAVAGWWEPVASVSPDMIIPGNGAMGILELVNKFTCQLKIQRCG